MGTGRTIGKSNDGSTLGDRMKHYERLDEYKINPESHIIVRCDGHKFSKFTKGFERPYDKILRDTMVQTTKDLCKEFGAITGYTQSDEISLVIPPTYREHEKQIKTISELYTEMEDCPEDVVRVHAIHKETKEKYWCYVEETCRDREELCFELTLSAENDIDDVYFEDRVTYGAQSSKQYGNIHEAFDDFDYFYDEIDNNQIYSGRVQKIASLVSAFATMRFNKILSSSVKNKDADGMNDAYYWLLADKLGTAWFDARVFSVKTTEEVFNAVMWRCRDAEKNSRSMFSHTYVSHKKLLNKNGIEQVQYTFDETGEDYNLMPESFKFGTFIKKEKYMKDVHYRDLNYKDRSKFNTLEMPQVQRTRYTEIVKDITTFSDENVQFVLAKDII